jgi:hypothetical protein
MKGNYLLSRIPVNARLLAKPSVLASVLSSYPWLRQLKKGSSLKYAVGEEREDCFYTIEFSKDSVLLTIHSKSSPLYYTQEAMLRILTVFSALEGLYEPDVRSLYPYLINLLASDRFIQLSERLSSEKQDQELGSDIVLAKRINALLSEKARLMEKLENEKKKSISLLSKFLIIKYGSNIDLEAAAMDTGIEDKEIENTLKQMEEQGYKNIRMGKKKFSLVRA